VKVTLLAGLNWPTSASSYGKHLHLVKSFAIRKSTGACKLAATVWLTSIPETTTPSTAT
jgi:hypothetical protein